MRLLRRCSGPCLLFVLAIAAPLCADLAFGQTTQSPIDTGLQILQGLTPEQRGQLSQQLGTQQGNVGNANTLGNRTQPELEQRQSLLLQQERDQLVEQQKRREEMQRLSPFLQGDDWIVITIDSSPLPAQAPQLSLNPLQTEALGGLTGTQQNQLGNLTQLAGTAQNPLGETGTTGAEAAAALGTTGTTTSATGPATLNVTAGGYAPLPPNCNGQPNCDTSQPVRPEFSEEQKKQRQDLIDLIRSRNPYQLSHDGTLNLPGFAPIPLGGLTERLATLRLGAESPLQELFIRVTKLPLVKRGPTALKPFGYDLFDRQISTFAPATEVPVPSQYILGPGDVLEVQLFGSRNLNLALTVDRNGQVRFPELGPVNVSGQTFESVKTALESRVERQMIGVHANVTMGDTRTIRVFVLGSTRFPGSYTISGLGTITSALFAAGGVLPIGSLRNIELKRRGELVRRLDLYDMLIRGDTTDDARLLPGDVVFIPPIGPTVGVDGEVHRPAIYEIRNESTIADVVGLAGGFTPEADTARLALTRIESDLRRVVLRVDLSTPMGRSATVHNGDMLQVSRLRPTLDEGVMVQGYVYTPGVYAYHAGMRLTDVLRSVGDLKPEGDLHYILIRREMPPDLHVVVLSADLDAALRAPGSAADVPLMAHDRLTVFDLQSSREQVIRPLLEDLKLQSNIGRPDEVVRIEGRTNVPGEYPFEAGMTVRDLIRAGGGLSDSAYGGSAELTRYLVVNGESRQAELIHVDLAAVLRGDPSVNLPLQPFDRLSIKQVEAWTEQGTITLRGQVKFPGTYSIRPGETLKSVLLRAGGLTRYAFPRGSIFTREELREREQKELDMLAHRMQNDIAFVALQGTVANQAGAASALNIGQSLLAQLRQAKAVGRLVIDLPRILSSPIGSPYDVIVRDGDQLIVPKFQQEVTVIGEVQTVTSHLYRPGLSRDAYIALSGGETARADGNRIYVVRADGSVVAKPGGGWFRKSTGARIEPGDTIVVPLNAEHIPALPLWTQVTQILYNLAIAFLAIRSA